MSSVPSVSVPPNSLPGSARQRRRVEDGWLQDRPEQPATKERLLELLLEKYWQGVAREIKHILLSLAEIRDVGLVKTEVINAGAGDITGYNTFIDQICESNLVKTHAKVGQSGWARGDPHEPWHPFRKPEPSDNQEMKDAVAAELQKMAQTQEDYLHLQARLLLQAAGFLDIDKLIGHREPVETHGFHIWRKGQTPQRKCILDVRLERWNEDFSPSLTAARCAIPKCRNILRGVLFQCRRQDCQEVPRLTRDDYICEKCFRQRTHPQDHLVKVYKHHILDAIMLPHVSRKLCRCSDVAPFDANGSYTALYPIDPNAKHRWDKAQKVPKCRLFQLSALVVDAKRQGLETPLENKKQLQSLTKDALATIRTKSSPRRPLRHAAEQRLEEQPDADIPFVSKTVNSKFPFGNTHVALMVGPLIIENGVEHTKGGVFISSRHPLNYLVPPERDEDLSDCLTFSRDRKIYTQKDFPVPDRRLKACMKQVVGGAFSRWTNEEQEDEIIQCLVSESLFPNGSTMRRLRHIHAATTRLKEKIKPILEGRIILYLEKIVTHLFDVEVDIEWHATKNSCQSFCDSILRHGDFGSLFGTPEGACPYLLSFVVRKEGYDYALVESKHDVPNGLTEEYLFGFRSGRHDDADIIDTLQEYWYDWGAFGQHLYRFQDLFPWDCTEAYRKDPTTCGTCDISKHVWAFPFDSWSMIHLHLQKGRHWYCPSSERGYARLTDQEWMDNRTTLLLAQDALIKGAVAMSRTPALLSASAWFMKCPEPQYDRLKLGGIHRAQPFSHRFEVNRFTHFYLAPWAPFTRPYRIKCYELLRATRKQQRDVCLPKGHHDLDPLGLTTLIGNLGKSYVKIDNLTEDVAFFTTLVEIATVGGLDHGFGTLFGAPDLSDHVDTLTGIATLAPDPSSIGDLASGLSDLTDHISDAFNLF
ncbi:hypothetical protein AYL99_07130 [Fonsecaea erecta]|uniref:Uncharacterized protein n=1 Tax=Fonsecaea erecta TaxID=1367422 RepID=A0A178ZDZ6_9EURO|nr:hypothetical protein AYL99_07130 [Fonsecaea erecta]OAP58040.1 hypothetical protein AYL99_07130 [Fonsecaea erecta]